MAIHCQSKNYQLIDWLWPVYIQLVFKALTQNLHVGEMENSSLYNSPYIAILLNNIIFVLSKKEVAQMWAGANQWIGSGPPQRISIYHTSTLKEVQHKKQGVHQLQCRVQVCSWVFLQYIARPLTSSF